MKQATMPMTPHRQEACALLSPIGQKFFPFIEFDEDEQLLGEIRKHPVGQFMIMAGGVIVALVTAILTIVLAANVSRLGTTVSDPSSLQNIIFGIGFVVSVIALLGTVIPVYIYRSSVIFITSEKIAEVMYVSLFNRKITQLGIGNVEDVTYSQLGILPRMFDFGTLNIQTASDTDNAVFSYVPLPNKNTQLIIEAHEQFVKKYGN
jgi:hypothetical protein